MKNIILNNRIFFAVEETHIKFFLGVAGQEKNIDINKPSFKIKYQSDFYDNTIFKISCNNKLEVIYVDNNDIEYQLNKKDVNNLYVDITDL
jgi:hypothetical protein